MQYRGGTRATRTWRKSRESLYFISVQMFVRIETISSASNPGGRQRLENVRITPRPRFPDGTSRAHLLCRDSLFRRSPSSPDRQTIRRVSASPSPLRPCRDLRRSRVSTAASIADVSVTCRNPRASTCARGSPPSLHTMSSRSFAILPEITFSASRPCQDGGVLRWRNGTSRDRRDQPCSGGRKPRCSTSWRPPSARRLLRPWPRNSPRSPCSATSTAGVVGGQAGLHEPRLLLVRQFGQRLRDLVDPGLVELQRQQIGIGEIAIVVRLFLRAHGAGLAGAGVEQARLLIDRAAGLRGYRPGGAPRIPPPAQ